MEFEITLRRVYHIFAYMDWGGKVCPLENMLYRYVVVLQIKVTGKYGDGCLANKYAA